MKYKVRKYDANSYQVLDGEKLVAVAIKYANDLWRAHDASDKRIDGQSYHPTPKAVAKALAEGG